MSDTITANVTSKATPATPKVSKSAVVLKLLSRAKGATVAEVVAATGWQPHTVRAYFSGLRKKGSTLLREERKDSSHAYRIAPSAGPAPAKQAIPHVGKAPSTEGDEAGAAATSTADA